MIHFPTARWLTILAGLVLVGATLSTSIGVPPAAAHGSTQEPASRTYACRFESPNNPMCAAAWAANSQALYDWMEVNIGDANGRHRELIPDGQLCGAGRAKYAAFNQPGAWPLNELRTDASGHVDLVYENTAPHSTAYYRVYITRPGFDARTDALGWNDLELAFDSGPLDRAQTTRLRVPLPTRNEPAILYIVWQRSDSPEAFYACSDITVNGGGPGPAPTTTAPAPTTPTTAPTTRPAPPTTGPSPTAPPTTPPAPSTTTQPTTTSTTTPAPPMEDGGVSGAVAYTDGTMAPNIVVDLFKADGKGGRGQWVGDARTDRSGRYEFAAPAGDYVLTFIAPGNGAFVGGRHYAQPSVTVAAGQTVTGVDAQLVSGGPNDASIGGSVTDAATSAGRPADGITVDLFLANGDGSRGLWLGDTRTSSDGTYSLGVQPGCHVLTFIAPPDRHFDNGMPYHQPARCLHAGERVSDVNAKLQ